MTWIVSRFSVRLDDNSAEQRLVEGFERAANDALATAMREGTTDIKFVAPYEVMRAYHNEVLAAFAERRDRFHGTHDFKGGAVPDCGYHDDPHALEAFHHGIDAVFDALVQEVNGDRRRGQ